MALGFQKLLNFFSQASLESHRNIILETNWEDVDLCARGEGALLLLHCVLSACSTLSQPVSKLGSSLYICPSPLGDFFNKYCK